MFRLTREVRFAVNAAPDEQLSSRPSNSFGGFPTLTGAGQYFVLEVTVAGETDPASGYLLNIKRIDESARSRAVPMIARMLELGTFRSGGAAVQELFETLAGEFAPAALDGIRLHLTPTLNLQILAPERPMIRLSQKFEFSASHRLQNSAFSEEQNRAVFGKCHNPHGHGHNYILQVTLAGEPDADGLLINVPDFERIVATTVIDRFDHRNLNIEVPEFGELNPSVENIAMVIFRMLAPRFDAGRSRLASVTVWETPKTWCEYSE